MSKCNRRVAAIKNKIYSYSGKDQKKVLAANWFYLRPEFRPKFRWSQKSFRHKLVQTSPVISDLLKLPATFLSECPERFFLVRGLLNLDGETRPPNNLSTGCGYISSQQSVLFCFDACKCTLPQNGFHKGLYFTGNFLSLRHDFY